MQTEKYVIGFLIAIVIFAIVICSFGFGRQSVLNDCENYGKFVESKEVFSCEKVGVKSE